MDRLPPELLHMILQHIDNEKTFPRPDTEPTVFQDLKNLRLSCKIFADLVTPLLFREHYVGLFDASLSNFVALSKHSVISKHVKQVCFVGDVLPKLRNQREWEEDVDLRPRSWDFTEAYISARLPELPSYNALKKSWKALKPMDAPDYEALRIEADEAYHALPRHQLTPAALKAHWAKYNEHRKQQEAWGPAEDKKFIEAFARLPHLYHAYNTLSDLSADLTHPPLPSVRKEILSFEAEARHDELWSEQPIHMKHAKCLLEALSYRARHMNDGFSHIKELNISNYGEQAFAAPIPPEPVAGWALPRDSVQLTFEGFEHLTQLDLDVSHFLPDTEDLDHIGGLPGAAPQLMARGQSLISEVKNMLSKLNKIVDLRLRLHPSGPGNLHLSDTSRDMLGKLGPLKYPHLKILEISATTTRQTLLGFLRRHAKTLRDLDLELCDLIGETPCWESVISQLPKILTLDSIHLESLAENGGDPLFSVFNEEHQKLVESWVMNGGKLDPPMTREELMTKYGAWVNIDVIANLDAGELPEMGEQLVVALSSDEDEDWNSDDIDEDEEPNNRGPIIGPLL